MCRHTHVVVRSNCNFTWLMMFDLRSSQNRGTTNMGDVPLFQEEFPAPVGRNMPIWAFMRIFVGYQVR